MSTLSQGDYASAMGSLDWLDVSYSPLQLTEKFRLPTLVRIGEGHYGNEDDTCFSAMEVVKLHGVQRVDMVIAESVNDTDDPSSAPPIRICLPKGLAVLFNVHHPEDGSEGKAAKMYKSVRQLADEAPQCVMVVKKPCRKDCGIVKGDIFRTIGITMCNGIWEEQGLRCLKQGESREEIILNLKWKGQYKTVPDPEGYTLADIVSQNKLPCVVTLLNPEQHLTQLSTSISKLLPHLQRPLVLEREITNEFLVGTTIGGGPRSSPTGNNFTSGLSTIQDEHQQPAIVVLSKNANVCFQICQDMVHRRITYTSLLEMFTDCTMDKIPLELFISEYAAPFVAFMRTDPYLVGPPMAASRHSQMSQRTLSRSTPDLPSTKNNEDDLFQGDRVIHNYADPGKGEMSKRALPPLPTDKRCLTLQPRQTTLPASSLTVNNGSEDDERIVRRLEGLHAPPNRSARTLSHHLQSISSSYPSQRAFLPQSEPRNNPVSVPHPEPPLGFTSDMIETEHHKDQAQRSPDSPERLPSRRPPPPPPRTTPRIVEQEDLYSNLGDPPSSASAPLLPAPPPTNDLTPPSKPTGKSPPEIVPRRRGIRVSHSLKSNQGLSTDRLGDNSTFLTIPLRGKQSQGSGLGGGCTATPAFHDTHTDYLQPRKSRSEAPTKTKTLAKIVPSRSHNSTGMLLDDFDLSNAMKPNKGLSASASNLHTTGLPAVSIRKVKDIPPDIGSLSCSELTQCFRLLNLDDQIIERLQRNQINGSLLVKLSSATVKDELALSDFEAEKVDAFRQGWRPDDSEAS